MSKRPLTVAWISYFPTEWLPNAPDIIRQLPKRHPATWQRVLADELKARPEVRLHIIDLRKELLKDVTFECDGVTFHSLKVMAGCRAPSLFWLDTLLIKRRLRQIDPDVIHAWGSENGAAIVASRLGYPYVVSVQGLLELFCQLLKTGWYDRLTARLERTSLRRAAEATGESSFTVDWLRPQYPQLDVRHVEYSPNWLFFKLKRNPQTKPIHFLFVLSEIQIFKQRQHPRTRAHAVTHRQSMYSP